MAIDQPMNYKYISGKDAKASYRNAQAAKAVGNETTARGTLIRKSNTEFDKNSFLKILSAQLSHLDPTQNQDSSAYVSQMAQFASMEQMANLNTTMSDYAHQEMVGKQVIVNEKDENNQYITGTVSEVIRKSGSTYYNVVINGKVQEIDSKNIIGVTESEDYNLNVGSRTAVNSEFMAASSLASKNQNVLVADMDENNKVIVVKGKVTGAYIDKISNPEVMIKVEVVDANNKSTTKTYKYSDVISAGDLTEEEMNTTIEQIKAAQAKVEAEAQAKAEAEAKAKAEADAKAAADAQAQAGTAVQA